MGKPFSKDGSATKFFEELPIIGYIPAAVHGIAGNKDEAIRATGKSTGSLLSVAGAVGGGLVGGPAGAVAGGAAGGAVGELVKDGITGEKVDPANVIISSGLGGIGGAFGGIGKVVAFEGVGLSLTRATLVGVAGSQVITKVFIGIPINLTTEKTGDNDKRFVVVKLKGTSFVVSMSHGRNITLQEHKSWATNQQWRFKDAAFRNNANSSVCLDVEGGAASDCTSVITYQIHGGANQRWVYNTEKLTLESASGGEEHYFLSVKDSEIKEGGQVQVCKTDGGKKQQFELVYAD